ncbi:MAG: hypothetical protein D6696_05135 [Acidobacteria bacterium]|nr:MAG: hypothetical protein D6696_05135 [Acidobacteriota bacterium]
MLEAVRHYDRRRAQQPHRLPPLVVVATGRGPQRDAFLARSNALPLRHVALRTLWLEPEDYPLLLGAADLGLCFHRSSSGLDLPMKVADMRGAGLPVCALAYAPVVEERLRHGDGVLLFRSGEELGRQLVDLLAGFPGGEALAGLRQAAAATERWHDGWRREARPLFGELLGAGPSRR